MGRTSWPCPDLGRLLNGLGIFWKIIKPDPISPAGKSKLNTPVFLGHVRKYIDLIYANDIRGLAEFQTWAWTAPWFRFIVTT